MFNTTKNVYTLSNNKKEYLERMHGSFCSKDEKEVEKDKNYAIYYTEIDNLIEHYEKKYEIKIIKNNEIYERPHYCWEGSEFMLAEAQLKNIMQVRENLKEDEIVGYVDTNGLVSRGGGHIETYIISKNAIIQPITWPFLRGFHSRIPFNKCDVYRVDEVFNFTVDNYQAADTPKYSDFEIYPQKDGYSCNALNFSCLKKLLRNGAEELKTLSLALPYYKKSGIKKNFYFPPPSILAYSQSRSYIDFMECLIKNEEDTFSFKGSRYANKTYYFFTLKKILEISLEISESKQDLDATKKIEQALKDLPLFREKWLSEFNKIEQKVVAMTEDCHGKKILTQLSYTAERIYSIAKNDANPFFKTNCTDENKVSMNRHILSG